MPLEILARSLSTLPAPAQCVLEEMAGREAELGALREKAHHLWEGQAAGKGFVHRVSQLSAQYLALSNLTKVTTPPRPVTTPNRHHLRLCAHSIVSLEAALSEVATTSPETSWMGWNVGRSPGVYTIYHQWKPCFKKFIISHYVR